MEQLIDFERYDPAGGLKLRWEEGFELDVNIDSGEVLLRGNPAGLVSLARHLLTLAQEGVPSGAHVHLTAGQEVDGEVDLIVERVDD